MKNAVKRFIEAEDNMIKTTVCYAAEEGSFIDLDGGQYKLVGAMMEMLRASNEVLLKEAEVIESMQKDLIEIRKQLDKQK